MVGVALCVVVLGLLAAVPVFAGSAVVGSVSGSMNATVSGQAILPNATLFSGDSLQVKDGMAVVSLGKSSRMVFGRDTVASFLRDSNEVKVLLDKGSVSVFHDANGAPVRMKIGGVSVIPVSGFKTLGEVAVLNGAVVVTAKDGMLQVEGNGPTVNVAKGKTVTLYPKTNAPTPGGAVGAGLGISMTTVDTILAGASAIMAGVTVSKDSTASSNASSAASVAAGAYSTAQADISAINAAGSASAATINSLGCALDTLAGEEGKSSPYTPPAGETCPPS
jgi:hypothetical protein